MPQEKRRRFPLRIFEVVLLAIVLPIIFYYTGSLIWEPMNWWSCEFFSIFGLLAVLGFDCAWIMAMKLVPFKNLRIKIYMTLFVLTISAVILTGWVGLNLLSNVW